MTKKKAKSSGRKKRKAYCPLSAAEAKRLGFEYPNMVEADIELHKQRPRLRKSLQEYAQKYSEIGEAWERGRFLRELGGLARLQVSVTKAARKLKLKSGQQLRDILDSDDEAGDLWDSAQLGVFIEVRQALIEEAKGGNAAAIRALESSWGEEAHQTGGFEPSQVTIAQLCEITGKNRKTIHEWHTQFGLPRNTDKTFDLAVFFSWFESHIAKRPVNGRMQSAELDPLKAVKAEKLQLELARHRNDLLDRSEVIVGQVAWVQNIVTFCSRGAAELARLCAGQRRERMVEILIAFFRELHAEAAKVPAELKLPEAAETELVNFLTRLKPLGQKGQDKTDAQTA